MSTPPRKPSPRPQTAYPPSTQISASAAHSQIVVAQKRLAQAESALKFAALVGGGESQDGGSRLLWHSMGASRVRAILYARHESRVRVAFLRWLEAVAIIQAKEDALPAAEVEEEAHLRGTWSSTSLRDDGDAGINGGGGGGGGAGGSVTLLEAMLAHLRPAALQHALRTWSRATGAIQMSNARATALEAKWATQRAFQLESANAGQLLRSVLRWWQNGDLSRVWRVWRDALREPVVSPHVRVSLS